MDLDARRLSERSYLFHCAVLDAREMSVASFEATEEVNSLYSVDVLVLTSGAAAGVPEREVLGQRAALAVFVPERAPRTFHGIVISVRTEQVYEDGRVARRFRVAPRMWLLTRRRFSRIFQDKSVREIVDYLLDGVGAPREWRTTSAYQARTYCVQYDETDHELAERLLAEEGIFHCFEQPLDVTGDVLGEGERVVLGDGAAYAPIPSGPDLAFRRDAHTGGVLADEDSVGEISLGEAVEPTAVRLLDYDFRRPRLDLTTRVGTDTYAGTELLVYDHHGENADADLQTSRATKYLEQLRAPAITARGASLCRRLTPGARVVLSGHEMDRVNGSYVVVRVEHRGTTPDVGAQGEARYVNRFVWAPASVVVRPRRPARVRQQVMESATVVGPPGQEIHTDALGRVKVQFPWDRDGRYDDHSSCYLRVMTAWAGDGFGVHFLPRVGMEVLIGFIGGDVDRPVVMGCLHNATHPVPDGLPGAATRSTLRSRSSPNGGGFNEIAFEDEQGNEQLFVHAQRNLEEIVGNNHQTEVRRDRRETVRGHRTIAVFGDRTDETAGGHEVRVGSGRNVAVTGNDALRVTGQLSAVIEGDLEERVRGDELRSVEGSREVGIKGSAQSVIHGRSLVYVGERATTVLGADAEVTVSGNLALNVGQALSLSVGSAAEPKSASAAISGDLSLAARGMTELTIEKELTIRCGDTTVKIAKDSVTITTKKIVLEAESIDAASKKASLSMGDKVEIRGPEVKLASDDKAILELGKEAKLDGQAVKIKPGLTAETREQEKREEQARTLEKESIVLFDRKGEPIQNAPYEISFFGWLEEGISQSGTVLVPKFPDVEVCHLRWGRPKDKRENPDDPREYEFSAEIYLQDGKDDEETAARKLHNLGYRGRDVSEAVHALQRDLKLAQTGAFEDAAGDIQSRHDGARPVTPEERG